MNPKPSRRPSKAANAKPPDIASASVPDSRRVSDVYALAPHTGRGGWSWYTGSAG